MCYSTAEVFLDIVPHAIVIAGSFFLAQPVRREEKKRAAFVHESSHECSEQYGATPRVHSHDEYQ